MNGGLQGVAMPYFKAQLCLELDSLQVESIHLDFPDLGSYLRLGKKTFIKKFVRLELAPEIFQIQHSST